MILIAAIIGIVIAAIWLLCGKDDADDSGLITPTQQQDAIVAEITRARNLSSRGISPVSSPIRLPPTARCYLVTEAMVLENRRVRTGTAFAGPTLSIPIVKSLGLRFRAGYFAHTPTTTDKLMPIDAGKMIVTNQSIMVIGEKGTRNIPIDSIVSVGIEQTNLATCPFLVRIMRNKGRTPYICMEHPGNLLAVLHHLLGDNVFELPSTYENNET